MGAVALITSFQSHAPRADASLTWTPTDQKGAPARAWMPSHGGTARAREVHLEKVAGMTSATEAKALWRALEDRGGGRVTAGATGTIRCTRHPVHTHHSPIALVVRGMTR